MLENWLELTPYFFGRKMQGVRYVSRLGGECSILLSYRDIYSKNPYFSRLFGLPGKEPGSSGTLFGLADPSIFASDFEGDFANEHGIMSSVLAKPVKSER